MSESIGRAKYTAVLLVVAFVMSVSAENRQIGQVKRLYIIAVHDSSLFTFCPIELQNELKDGLRNFYPRFFGSYMDGYYVNRIFSDGRLLITPQQQPGRQTIRFSPMVVPPPFFPRNRAILDRSRPNWEELMRLANGVTPAGWADIKAQKQVEAELKRHKNLKIVESPEQADYVFLIEGLNFSSWQLDAVRMNIPADSSFGFGQPICQLYIGIVVPSEIYRRNPTDAEAFLTSRFWAGISMQRFEKAALNAPAISASAKALAASFLKLEKWPYYIPPICPAWVAPQADPPTVTPPTLTATRINAETVAKRTDSHDPSAIRVETTLVTVPVVVSDLEGRHISGLEPGEFHVFENGIEQRIDRVIADSAPFHTALLMDNSPSTAISGKNIAKSALDFLSTLRLGDASMMLSFGDQIHIDSEFTEDANRLRYTILGRDVANVAPSFQQHELSRMNLTRFYDAVDLTLTERMSKITGRKAILVFTDGLDVGSRLANAGTLLARVEESGVLIYAIKYETPDPKLPNKVAQKGITAAYAEGAEYLRHLTTNSGGRLLNVKSTVDVEQAFSLIADELRHQFMICYYPTDRNTDGAFRRINVVVDKPGVRVRARTGYRPSRR